MRNLGKAIFMGSKKNIHRSISEQGTHDNEIVSTIQEDNVIGTRMTWNEIAKQYPDMYVALEDYQTSKDLTTGILRGVGKTREDLIPLMQKYAKAGNKLWCFYTTENMRFNGLWLL